MGASTSSHASARKMSETSAPHAASHASLGVALVFGVAVWLFLIMDRSFNTIWRAHRSRAHWKSAMLYAGLLIAGPLLIGVSVSITTYLVSLSAMFGGATSR